MACENTQTSASSLIANALDSARLRLGGYQMDLAKAQARVAELTDTCERLTTTIAGLEHDQNALNRGYIAIMGDKAAPPPPDQN